MVQQFPKQKQSHQPGKEYKMDPHPDSFMKNYKAAEKLKDKVAVVTGGDSGIGRAVAIAYAKEGADVAVMYLEEDKDAKLTKQMVEKEGAKCELYRGDVGSENFCRQTVESIANEFGRIDILVNNAGEQHKAESIEDITEEQLLRTFKTNIFSMFYMTKAVLPHLKKGSCIVNCASITAYHGNPQLLDYSATKGAVVTFTRALSNNLVKKGIRVNAVAPGPIWTPLIPASFDEEKVAKFGANTPMGRAGQPDEVAPCFVFLACNDSSYISGQVLHPNGGEVVNG